MTSPIPASGRTPALFAYISAGIFAAASGAINIVSRDTQKPLDGAASCWKSSVTLGYNPETTKKAHADAVAFLKEKVLK